MCDAANVFSHDGSRVPNRSTTARARRSNVCEYAAKVRGDPNQVMHPRHNATFHDARDALRAIDLPHEAD